MKQYKVTVQGYKHKWRWIHKLTDMNKHYHILIWKTNKQSYIEHLCGLGWRKRDDLK